jgi:hypothetical protein
MTLIRDLKAAAIKRALFPAGASLDAPAVFALVRDMPYRRASSHEPAVTIEEWRGTCSGKHILLQSLFEELRMGTMMILALHEFTALNSPWLSPSLLTMLHEAPVRDVHNFLRVQPLAQLGPQAEWVTVDATWPLAVRKLGIPVNEILDLKNDMGIAADPDEVFHVPPDTDPSELKERILQDLSPGELTRREEFLAKFMDWLGEALPVT